MATPQSKVTVVSSDDSPPKTNSSATGTEECVWGHDTSGDEVHGTGSQMAEDPLGLQLFLVRCARTRTPLARSLDQAWHSTSRRNHGKVCQCFFKVLDNTSHATACMTCVTVRGCRPSSKAASKTCSRTSSTSTLATSAGTSPSCSTRCAFRNRRDVHSAFWCRVDACVHTDASGRSCECMRRSTRQTRRPKSSMRRYSRS